MAEVVWTKKAFGQLERAIRYILEEQGTSYAEIVLKQIRGYSYFAAFSCYGNQRTLARA